MQNSDYYENSSAIIANYVTKVYEHLYNEIFIAFGSFCEIFFTFFELVSYVVVFTAAFIFLVTVFSKVYLMYSNAMNSANSLMNIFRSSLLFGTRQDTQQNRAPLVRPERFAQEGNVSDTENDDSLMNNARNRVPRRPQQRRRGEPGRNSPQPSRVNTQTGNEEHRPSSSGEHSQTQTAGPSHPPRENSPKRQTDADKLVRQLEEERDEFRSQLLHEKHARALQEEMVQDQLHSQDVLHQETSRFFTEKAEAVSRLEAADESRRVVLNQSDRLKTELHALKVGSMVKGRLEIRSGP